jgi:hypothetical protein
MAYPMKPGCDPHYFCGAWQLAEKTCEAQLVRTDGSLEEGMKRLGSERFSKWVDRVEHAIESCNPKEE